LGAAWVEYDDAWYTANLGAFDTAVNDDINDGNFYWAVPIPVGAGTAPFEFECFETSASGPVDDDGVVISATYPQYSWTCDTIAYNYSDGTENFSYGAVYECTNEAGCTAHAPGTMALEGDDDWYSLRFVASIVTEWTYVDCIPYENYMYILVDDVVCTTDERLYTCLSGDMCSNVIPSEDQAGTIWAPTVGYPNPVEITEDLFIDVMPYWVYAYNYEVMNLLPGDMFQAFDAVYTVDDDWQANFDTAMSATGYADSNFAEILLLCDYAYWYSESLFLTCLGDYGSDSITMSR